MKYTALPYHRLACDEIRLGAVEGREQQRKHGLTFVFGTRVFEDPLHVDVDASRDDDGEQRRKAIGAVDGKLYSPVYTIRAPVIWIISVRRTNPKEDRLYADLRP